MTHYVYLCLRMGENSKRESVFRFKQFEVNNSCAAMKVGTDAVLLGAWVDVAGVKSVLDAGTGTGLLALMVAQRAPEAMITAVEIDGAAAREAQLNAAMSPWSDRIRVVEDDFMKYTHDGGVDLIVSNPPYFATTLKSPDEKRAMARHGDVFTVETLISRAAGMLSERGRLCFISPSDREDDILVGAAFAGLNLARRVKVFTKQAAAAPTRILWEFTPSDVPCVFSELRVNTPAYRNIVSPYYLDNN